MSFFENIKDGLSDCLDSLGFRKDDQIERDMHARPEEVIKEKVQKEVEKEKKKLQGVDSFFSTLTTLVVWTVGIGAVSGAGWLAWQFDIVSLVKPKIDITKTLAGRELIGKGGTGVTEMLQGYQQHCLQELPEEEYSEDNYTQNTYQVQSKLSDVPNDEIILCNKYGKDYVAALTGKKNSFEYKRLDLIEPPQPEEPDTEAENQEQQEGKPEEKTETAQAEAKTEAGLN